MVVPKFSLTQDDDHVFVHIKIPFVQLNSEADMYHDRNLFIFYSKPYYLRLNLPGELRDQELEFPEYTLDLDSSTMKIVLPKLKKGTYFEDLDLISKLLLPPQNNSPLSPSIEEIDEDTSNAEEICKLDLFMDLKPETDVTNLQLKYGFANRRSGVISKLQEDLIGIVDVNDPDVKYSKQIREERIGREINDFNEDRYWLDLHENKEVIEQLLKFKPAWYSIFKTVKDDVDKDEKIKFTEEESEDLRQLPVRKYLLNESELRISLLGLVDIIFACAFNERINEGDQNVQSDWNICKISATLSWLETFSTLDEVVISCIRRSLCYPLYRNWDLAMKVIQDTASIFSLGKKQLTKCVIQCRRIFMKAESRYILNDLYLKDYCIWIQQCNSCLLEDIASCLKKIKIDKRSVGLDLEVVELAAELALKEGESDTDSDDDDEESESSEEENCEIARTMEKLKITGT